jgi:hypothetical protein
LKYRLPFCSGQKGQEMMGLGPENPCQRRKTRHFQSFSILKFFSTGAKIKRGLPFLKIFCTVPRQVDTYVEGATRDEKKSSFQILG